MAFIVLGVGAVMVLAGAGEIYYGSGFLEIERGWSTFIAGTVLLTGGLLTMALGLAMRSLGEVKGALLQLGGGGLAPLALRAAPDIAIPAREPPVALRPADPALVIAAGGPALQIEPHFGAAIPPTDVEETPPLRLRDEPEAAPHVAPPVAGEARPATVRQHEPALSVPAAAPEPDAGIGTHAAHGGPDDHYADYTEMPAEVATPEHEAAPPASEPMPAPAAAPPPTVPSAAARPAPPTPAPASAVIGRYEADGTSYVMYADGSIEAQSEAGIYRFASMAELKSFIET